MKLVCLSDTHDKHEQVEVPAGDVLIHAGDFCGYGTREEATNFIEWFAGHPHPKKILVAGNHDKPLSYSEYTRSVVKSEIEDASIIYLEDSGATINGIHFYGSPWTPAFGQWSFMKDDEQLQSHWEAVPDKTDVLITHGPKKGVLDWAYKRLNRIPMSNDSPVVTGPLHRQTGRRQKQRVAAGSHTLAEEIDRIDPDLHVFGHIHEAQGREDLDNRTYINASIVDRELDVKHEPQVTDF